MTSRESIGLQEESCTSCLICVRDCPSECIEIERHSEQLTEGRRPKTVHVLDAFRIDYALCMYCGICIDVCPTDALSWSPIADLSVISRDLLVSNREDLARRWKGQSQS
ncbi:MAG: 4Fe-4S binding protein [Actinomycetota bacterium]|nr:4Fe-4S binding protein [Actinomycetota bacterium]